MLTDETRCCRAGCTAAAADDANECPPHRDERRERVKRSMRKQRRKWATEGKCKRCGRERHPRSKWGCRLCDPSVNNSVNKAERVAANTTARTTRSNLGRTHYHGQGKRGPVSKAAHDAQDFDDAIRLAARSQAEMQYALSPEVQAQPRIQRENELHVSLATAARAVRHLAEILHRHKVDVAEIVETVGEDED